MTTDKQGILTPEQEAFYAQLLDDAVKFKGFLEVIDGYAFKAVISVVDNTLVDKIREDVKVKLSELAVAGQEKDIEKMEEISANILNTLVDIPTLDESSEYLLFRSAVMMVVAAIRMLIEKTRKAEDPA